jgi:hypothetical protein
MDNKKVLISGGIAGLTLGILLKEKGLEPLVIFLDPFTDSRTPHLLFIIPQIQCTNPYGDLGVGTVVAVAFAALPEAAAPVTVTLTIEYCGGSRGV